IAPVATTTPEVRARMPPRQLAYHSDARAALKRGVDAIADCVRPTLGPRGRGVVVEMSHGPPLATHDGASIAREIDLRASFENMGAQLVKQAIAKMNGSVGDGTTTAIVLTQGIVAEGVRLIAAGANPMLLKRGLDRAGEAAAERVRQLAAPIQSRA